MQDDVAISLQNVTISFNLNKAKDDNIKEYVIKFLSHKLEYKRFYALKNISFDVKKGERLAILGFNGAGKSTLLKAIVGVYKPTVGKVEKQGVIAPLLELGAGFDPNYSGKENIFLYGAILGYSRDYINSKYDEIVEFSELGNFINVPLKNYSSGMRARLGFSIATAVEPDVLILDEVLSVGDAKFRAKSLKKVQSMFDNGVTVLFVSHSIEQVKEICDKAILLDHGEMLAYGDVDEVSEIYERMTEHGGKKSEAPASVQKSAPAKKAAPGAIGAPYGLKTSPVGNTQLRLEWDRVDGATVYRVYTYSGTAGTDDYEEKLIASTAKNSYVFKELERGREYNVMVVASNGKKSASAKTVISMPDEQFQEA